MKPTFTFLLGAVFVSIVVFFTGAKAAYVAGAVTVLIPMALYPRKVAGALEYVADLVDGWKRVPGKQGKRPTVVAMPTLRNTQAQDIGYKSPSNKQRDQILHDTLEEYLGEGFETRKGA